MTLKTASVIDFFNFPPFVAEPQRGVEKTT
jgi:hypothetical protein